MAERLVWPRATVAAAIMIVALSLPPLSAAAEALAGSELGTPHARFHGEPASRDARLVADWVVAGGDDHALPFIIVDKVDAEIFVFDGRGLLLGAAPVLLGLARGDDTVPGIGTRKLASIRPAERTTPAGRFIAGLGNDLEQDILWIDYDAALSLHRVIKGEPREHRATRLAAGDPSVRRISYGCVNVPAAFYDAVVRPAFTGTSGVVYILPEIKSVEAVFGGYGLGAGARPHASGGAP